MNEDLTIGQNVKRLRGGVSQEELAKRMREKGFDFTKMTVYNIERGRRQLRLSEARAMLDILGYNKQQDMNELFVDGVDSKVHEAIRDLKVAVSDAEASCRDVYTCRIAAKYLLDPATYSYVDPDGNVIEEPEPSGEAIALLKKVVAEAEVNTLSRKLSTILAIGNDVFSEENE